METLDYKTTIAETFERVRNFSFEEKTAVVYDEAKVNKLLDKIIEFQKLFTDKADKINSVVENIEKLTWYTDVDSDSLMKINDLISSIRDLHYSLKRQYASLKTIRTKGIANAAIKNYKFAIDDLRDSASDLESRFFRLPALPDFEEITKELSLV
jgi:hypothetical protein